MDLDADARILDPPQGEAEFQHPLARLDRAQDPHPELVVAPGPQRPLGGDGAGDLRDLDPVLDDPHALALQARPGEDLEGRSRGDQEPVGRAQRLQRELAARPDDGQVAGELLARGAARLAPARGHQMRPGGGEALRAGGVDHLLAARSVRAQHLSARTQGPVVVQRHHERQPGASDRAQGAQAEAREVLCVDQIAGPLRQPGPEGLLGARVRDQVGQGRAALPAPGQPPHGNALVQRVAEAPGRPSLAHIQGQHAHPVPQLEQATGEGAGVARNPPAVRRPAVGEEADVQADGRCPASGAQGTAPASAGLPDSAPSSRP